MLTLDEYLGILIANLAQARVLADLESTKIAELYATNELLRHFSIPRMKIEDVELTIPVCIQEVTDGEEVENLDAKQISGLTYASILNSLGVDSLAPDVAGEVRSVITQQVEILAAKIDRQNADDLFYDFSLKISRLVYNLWDRLTEQGTTKEDAARERRSVVNQLAEKLQDELSDKIKIREGGAPLKRLRVVVESDKLKEKPLESMVLIKVKVSEEGAVWERMEDGEGNIISKLMPY